MLKRIFLVIALTLTATSASGDITIGIPTEPLAVIVGPTSTPAGELVEFDAGESTGAGYDWLVTGPSNCDGRWKVYEGGQILIFASPEPGEYRIVLSVALDNLSDLTAIVLQNGTGPDPPVPPVPPDPPVSPLSAKVTKWVIETVPVASRPKANPLAQIYREASAGITTGRLTTAEDAMAFVVVGSRKQFGSDRSAWLPWAANVKAELDSLWDAGKLKDVKAYTGVFDDIALGLEAVQ